MTGVVVVMAGAIVVAIIGCLLVGPVARLPRTGFDEWQHQP